MSASLNPFSFLVTAIAGWMSRHQQEMIAYLVEENRVLREQIGNQRLKFDDDQRRRLADKAKTLGRKTLDQVATIATPETLLTWHRKLIVRKTESPCRNPGRPSTVQEIAALAVRMAEENRSWGYRRIQGALANLGYDLAHNTIRNILKRHGIEPAPERARKTTWKQFLQRHWAQIMANDFFNRHPSKRSGLGPAPVILGFMKLSTRRVDVRRSSSPTDGLSMSPVVSQMTGEGLNNEKRDLGAKERPRTRCRHHRNRNEPAIGNVDNQLTMPFAVPDQKVRRIKRRQPRDRLWEYDEREAA